MSNETAYGVRGDMQVAAIKDGTTDAVPYCVIDLPAQQSAETACDIEMNSNEAYGASSATSATNATSATTTTSATAATVATSATIATSTTSARVRNSKNQCQLIQVFSGAIDSPKW